MTRVGHRSEVSRRCLLRAATALLSVLLLLAGAGCERRGATPAVAQAAGSDDGVPLDHPASDPGAACACAAATVRNGWCPRCNFGWIAGIKVTDAELFEMIDPHGHDFDPASIACAQCRDALDQDGFCNTCRMGFGAGRLYVSRLAWALGRAEAGSPPGPGCPACRGGAGQVGWCATCRMGRLGPLWYTNQPEFEVAVEERDHLLRWIALGAECRGCGLAAVHGVRCNSCGRDHRAQPAPASAP